MAKKYTNLLTIEQGSTWKFTINILDDEIYKLNLKDFLVSISSSFPNDGYITGLNQIIDAEIPKLAQREILLHLLGNLITDDRREEFENLFNEQYGIDLLGQVVKIYFKIFRSTGNQRTLDFVSEGTNGVSDGAVFFNIPSDVTHQMIHPTNRNYAEPVTGFYTIEVTNTDTNEIYRVLEGDVIVSRSAK